MVASLATHMVSPWENCDTLSRLSLKTHKRMNFCRSFAAAIVVCGASSFLAAPVSAQTGAPVSTNVQARLLNDFSRYNRPGRSRGGSMNQVGGVNRNSPSNSAHRRHLQLQRARAARPARKVAPSYIKGMQSMTPAGSSF